MTNYEDSLICSLCKGKKVLFEFNEFTEKSKVVVCPKCKGTGILVNEEQREDNRKILLG